MLLVRQFHDMLASISHFISFFLVTSWRPPQIRVIHMHSLQEQAKRLACSFDSCQERETQQYGMEASVSSDLLRK